MHTIEIRFRNENPAVNAFCDLGRGTLLRLTIINVARLCDELVLSTVEYARRVWLLPVLYTCDRKQQMKAVFTGIIHYHVEMISRTGGHQQRALYRGSVGHLTARI